MTEQEICALIEQGIPGASVSVGGDGYHIEIEVVSDAFAGETRVRRQQRVYATLAQAIRSGALHAVNIRAVTRAEHDASATRA